MKKILSFILVLAMILGCVSMVSFASGEATTTDEPVLGGGYIRAYNRLQSTISFPRYDLKDKITTAGTYHIQCYVRIPAYTSGNYYVYLYFMNADNTADGAQGLKLINVQNTEWKLVSWDVTISNTEAAAYYLRIDTTDTADFCLDAVSVRKVNEDGSYGENLVEDSNCDLGANTGWYANNCKIINPEANKAIKITNSNGAAITFVTSKGIWKDDGKPGLKSVSYTIYNPNDHDITFRTFMAADILSSWRNFTTNGTEDDDGKIRFYTVPANGKITITRSIQFDEDGTVSGAYNTTTPVNNLKPSEYAVRFDFNHANGGANTMKAGESLYIQDTRSDMFYIYGTPNGGTMTPVSEIPAFTENEAIKFTFDGGFNGKVNIYNKQYTSGNREMYYTGVSPTEINTDENSGERYILRQYAVYNNSDHCVLLKLYYQVDYLIFGAIDGIAYPDNPDETDGNVHLKPYETRLYSVKIPVNSNNTVSWTKTSAGTSGNANLDDLFVRIELDASLNNANGSYAMKAGDSVIIQPLTSGSSDPVFTLDAASGFTITDLQDMSEVNDLKGASLTLGSSLTYNITAMTEYGKDAEVKVTRTGKDNIDYIDTIPLQNGVANYTVNAQCMGDNIKIELYVDNVLVDTVDNYSIKQYAINKFTNSGSALDNILRDMLVYGAEAQKAIGYKTDALVTDDVSGAVLDEYYAAPTASATISNNNTLISSATLNISHVNKIRFKLTKTENVTVKINNVDVTDSIVGNYVYTDAIMATGFADEYTIEVSDGSNTATVTYSANVYIANKFNSTTTAGTTTIGALCQALNNYGQSAKAYKGL